jgi:hypothetical protein
MRSRSTPCTGQRAALRASCTSPEVNPPTFMKKAWHSAIGTLAAIGAIYGSVYFPLNDFSRALANQIINSKQTCGELIGFGHSGETNSEGHLHACFDNRHYTASYRLAGALYQTLEASLATGTACTRLHFSGLGIIFLGQQLTVHANRTLLPAELEALTYVLLSPFILETELIQEQEYLLYRLFSARSLPDIPAGEIGILNALRDSRDKTPDLIADFQNWNLLGNPRQTYRNTPPAMPWYLRFRRFTSAADPTRWRVFLESIHSTTGRAKWSTVLVELPRSIQAQRDRHIDSVRAMERSGAVKIESGAYHSRNDYSARFKANPGVPRISPCSGSTHRA